MIWPAVPTIRLLSLAFGVWSVSASVMTNQVMLQISRSSMVRVLPSSPSSCWISPRHVLMSSGVSWIPIKRAPVLTDAARRTLLVLETAEEDRRMRLLHRLGPEPAWFEIGDSPW